jgi:hypothetical protein
MRFRHSMISVHFEQMLKTGNAAIFWAMNECLLTVQALSFWCFWPGFLWPALPFAVDIFEAKKEIGKKLALEAFALECLDLKMLVRLCQLDFPFCLISMDQPT